MSPLPHRDASARTRFASRPSETGRVSEMTDAGEGPVVIKEDQLQEIAYLSRSEDTPKLTHIHICHIHV